MTKLGVKHGERTLGTLLRDLRQHAQALTGNRKLGDDLVDLASADLFANMASPPAQPDLAVQLFRLFHDRLRADGMTDLDRAAHLLHEIEKFALPEIVTILHITHQAAEQAFKSARTRFQRTEPAKVLLVEDEAILSMEMTILISDLGHRVTGVAMTQEQAIEMTRKDPADLIVLDINLADGSSGLDAYRKIVDVTDEVPVIVSTGFPDRLLAEEADCPIFLLVKPSTDAQFQAAISLAADVSGKLLDPWHRSVLGLHRFWPPKAQDKMAV